MRQRTHAKAIAICAIAIILALVVGVGVPSGLVLRHLVQTVPLWIVALLGFRRSRPTGWVGLPIFVFWFGLMALIWLYLFGIRTFFSGRFSANEIAMAGIVELMCLVGMGLCAVSKSGLPMWKAAALFAAFGVLQFVCFVVSFLPQIANR